MKEVLHRLDYPERLKSKVWVKEIWKNPGDKIFNLIMIIPVAAALFLVFTPFLSLTLKISLKALAAAAVSNTVKSALFLSLYSSAVSTAIACILGIAAAYILAFKKIPYKHVWNIVVTLPMVLPPAVGGYLLLLTFGRYGLVGHWFYLSGYSIMFTDQAIIIAQIFVILPFVINAVRTSFEGINAEYKEVALTMGASEWQIFTRVILPLSKPGIFSGAIMAFTRAMGEFGATMMVSGLNETMPIAIYRNATAGHRTEADILSMILIMVSFGIMILMKNLDKND